MLLRGGPLILFQFFHVPHALRGTIRDRAFDGLGDLEKGSCLLDVHDKSGEQPLSGARWPPLLIGIREFVYL